MTNKWVSIRPSRRAARAALMSSLAQHRVPVDDPSLVIAGPPEYVAQELRPYRDLGFSHFLASVRDPFDLETIENLNVVKHLLS